MHRLNLKESTNVETNKTSVKSSLQNSSCSVIAGGDLCKFYKRPLENAIKPGDIFFCEEETDSNSELSDNVIISYVSKSTQTDYRESETQTYPWDPPYKIRDSHKKPEVLLLKDLTYGKGLPASLIEIEYIWKTCRNKTLCEALGTTESDIEFQKKKQIICGQVKNEWDYRLSKHSQKQLERLKLMEVALANELNKQSEKQKKFLRSVWSKKKCEMEKISLKLQKELHKKLHVLECDGSASKVKNGMNKSKEEVSRNSAFSDDMKKRGPLHNQVDYLLSNCCTTGPDGLSEIKDWLEKKKYLLYNEIPLAKPLQRSKKEKLCEKAYQDLLIRKQTKMPPPAYHEDYDKEESQISLGKSEMEFEILELPDEGIDLATVWQQVLRGQAYQKQMLELIEKHKDALEVQLSHQTGSEK